MRWPCWSDCDSESLLSLQGDRPLTVTASAIVMAKPRVNATADCYCIYPMSHGIIAYPI
jgi:hypothetical protein